MAIPPGLPTPAGTWGAPVVFHGCVWEYVQAFLSLQLQRPYQLLAESGLAVCCA